MVEDDPAPVIVTFDLFTLTECSVYVPAPTLIIVAVPLVAVEIA